MVKSVSKSQVAKTYAAFSSGLTVNDASVIYTMGLKDLVYDVLQNGNERRGEVCCLNEAEDELWLDCFLNRFKSKEDWNILLTVNDITPLKKN